MILLFKCNATDEWDEDSVKKTLSINSPFCAELNCSAIGVCQMKGSCDSLTGKCIFEQQPNGTFCTVHNVTANECFSGKCFNGKCIPPADSLDHNCTSTTTSPVLVTSSTAVPVIVSWGTFLSPFFMLMASVTGVLLLILA